MTTASQRLKRDVLEKIPLQALEAAQYPIESATGLPNAAYQDDQVFEFERDHVIAGTWAGLAFASELPQPGFAKPVDFMGLPILIIRDERGVIKVFHNVCSHRGMVLVPESGPVRNLIRCRYHSWSYDLHGTLKSTPHIGGVGKHTSEQFSCEAKGLKQIASGEWMGMVFINLSGQAGSLEEFIAPLQHHWQRFTGSGGLENLQVDPNDSNAVLEVEANWKLAIENYCEAYHLPWVHPDLNAYSPLDQHINLHINEYMSGQSSLNYSLTKVAGQSLPKFEMWPAERHTEAEYISLFPNILLGLQLDHVFAIILEPKAANRTIERLQISYVSKQSLSDSMKDCRMAVMKSWKQVFSEDVFAVESMQLGRKSPGFNGGHFSPIMDAPSHDFHKWLARQYQAALR